jgi:hypothetical protein
MEVRGENGRAVSVGSGGWFGDWEGRGRRGWRMGAFPGEWICRSVFFSRLREAPTTISRRKASSGTATFLWTEDGRSHRGLSSQM